MATSQEFRKIFIQLIDDLECNPSEIPKILHIDYGIFIKIRDYGWIPRPIILMRIADYFEISLEYLLGKTDDIYFEKARVPKTFHIRYGELKKENSMTDYAVAQKLHIPTSYTTNWKKHNYTPSLDNLFTLADLFGVSLDYLLGRTDERK